MSTARLDLYFLGTFKVALDDEPVSDFRSDTVRVLLAYLAMQPGIAHRREAVAGLLWPEVPEVDARRNLRVTLSRLRDAIHDREVQPPFLEITRNTIALQHDTGCTVDVWRLREALGAVASHDHVEVEMCDVCAGRLRTVDDLYRGEFLAGFSLDSATFEAWIVGERERLHWEVLEALSALTSYYERRGDHDTVIAYAQRQVALEPWRESAHRQWMRALALAGHRNAALAQYETCRQVLADELGVEPEAATLALYEQIRQSDTASPTVSSGAAIGPAAVLTHPSPGQVLAIQGAERSEPERRTVTVLHAAISGADGLLSDAGLESYADVLSGLLRSLGAEVARYGGEVDRYADDQLIALFGAVVAHEDDPERAVSAALALQRTFEGQLSALAVDAPEWRDGLINLDLQVVVHTGEAIVAYVDDGMGSPTVVGSAVAEARRLLAKTLPGEVRVSPATHRLVHRIFEWHRPDAPSVDGSGLVPVARLSGAGKGRGIPGMASPLVGRATELEALQAAVDQLRTGLGGIVTLVGEAGIGKSRLVAELQQRRAGDVAWIEGRCLSHSVSTAYALWVSALHVMIGVSEDASARVIGAKLRETLLDLVTSEPASPAADLPWSYAYLAWLLDVPLGPEDQAMIAQLEPSRLQDATFSAVEYLLDTSAHRQPLVLVCEDLHWADPTSLQLLERLLALTDRTPLLIVGVFRPQRDYGSWRIRQIAQRDYSRRHLDLQLQPLSIAEGEALLRNLLSSMPSPGGRPAVSGLTQVLTDRILSHGEGIPFYVEEVLRSLILRGAIVCDDAACAWQEGISVEHIGIPDTLFGVLRGRIDLLPSGARLVLQLASVIGRIFSHRLLAEIANRHLLTRHLALLQREELVRERTGPPELEYIFKHQLTRDATYDSLLQRVRRVLHRRVAEAIERLNAERLEEQLGRLAHHWEEAGEAGRAINYLLRAGDQAAAQYANEEALRHFNRAIALTPEHDLIGLYSLLSRRCAVYDRQGARQSQWSDIARLQAIAEALDEGAPSDSLRLAEVGLLTATYYDHVFDQSMLVVAAESAVLAARKAGAPKLEAAAEALWGTALEAIGDRGAAIGHLEKALNLARQVKNQLQEARVLRQLALGYGATPPETARDYLLRALHIHRELGNRAGEGEAYNGLSMLSLYWHHAGPAKAYGEEGLRLCLATGLRREAGWSLSHLGWALHDLGHYEASDRRCQEAIDLFERVNDPFGVAFTAAIRAWAARRAGDDEASYVYNSLAAELADAISANEPGIMAALTFGDILFGRADHVGALDAYQKALNWCEKLGWARQAVSARTGLAQVALAQGCLSEASTHVEAILRQASADAELRTAFHPMHTYLVCYRVLTATDDPRGLSTLEAANLVLQAWATEIEDEDLRQSFLQNVREHRTLVAAYGENQ